MVTNFGTMTLILHCDIAPKTGENFIELCERKYYNGVSFHRLVKNFCVSVFRFFLIFIIYYPIISHKKWLLIFLNFLFFIYSFNIKIFSHSETIILFFLLMFNSLNIIIALRWRSICYW